MPSWLVSGRRMKIVSNSRCVPGSSLIDRAICFVLPLGFARERPRTSRTRLFAGIHLVHRRRGPVTNDELHSVGRSTDQERQFLFFFFRKATEYVANRSFFSFRFPNPAAHANELGAAGFRYRSHSV